MAVKYLKGSSALGNIGTIASIAGMATGQPWLSAIGAGIKGADGLMNGYSTPGFQNTNNNPFQNFGLGGLFSGNIANPDFITQGGK